MGVARGKSGVVRPDAVVAALLRGPARSTRLQVSTTPLAKLFCTAMLDFM